MVDNVHLDFALMRGGEERPALLLVGIAENDIPIGSVIRQHV
jgi:hypothetical protein